MNSDEVAAALRALGFIALFQALGATLFVAGFGSMLSVSTPALRRLGMHSAWIAALLITAQFALEPVRMAGAWNGLGDASLRSLALHSSLAHACAGKLAGLTLIFMGLLTRHRYGSRIALLGIALTLLGFALVGHTAAHPQRLWLLPLLMLHLAAVTFWFGALLPLWRISRQEPALIAAKVVALFSRWALKLVPAIFVAGLLMTALLLPDTAALYSRYGLLLLTKITLFAVLMGLAALNRWRFGPRLAQADAAAGPAFRTTLLLEFVLIAGTLCVTAALTLFYSPG